MTQRLRLPLAFAFFVVVAVAQSWPLPAHMSTRLTGDPSGDSGVYVWNTWVFRHELVDDFRSPLSTLRIMPLDGPTDLSLHNYTAFADLLAVPLQPFFGVVATFNIIYLLNVALAGFGMYLLARRVVGREIESWLAGVLFACSPFLVTRGAADFSLVAAAPLPFCMWLLLRAWDSQRTRDAVWVGVAVAWAASCDPYYAVYCVMLAVGFIASRAFVFTSAPVTARPDSRSKTVLNVAIVGLAAVVAMAFVAGGRALRIGHISISMHTLYTPMLVLAILAGVRLFIAFRPRLARRPVLPVRFMLRASAAATFAAVVLLSPELYAMAKRATGGQIVKAPVLWRSSAPGVDLLSFLVPNPNHPLMPGAVTDWLAAQPGGYIEQVASLSLVALIVIAIAWRRARFRASRWWVAVAIGFGLLTLGPFVRVGGIDTYVPTPWTFLRYVPIIGDARMPPRFDIVAMLGLCVIFAGAMAALTARYPNHRRRLLWGVGFALCFELWPAPRTLYSAAIPDVYRTIAADSRPVRVLELPFGIRDGLSSLGNFSAASQYFQTLHGKALIGGYISRVPDASKRFHRRLPVLGALMDMSEGRPVSPVRMERARRNSDDFLDRARLGYVVMETARVSSALRRFAIELLALTKIGEADGRELFVSQTPPLPGR